MNESNSKHNVLKFEHAGYDLYIRDVWQMRIYIFEMCGRGELKKQIRMLINEPINLLSRNSFTTMYHDDCMGNAISTVQKLFS